MKLKEVETVSESSPISKFLAGPPASSFNRCFIFIIREKIFFPFGQPHTLTSELSTLVYQTALNLKVASMRRSFHAPGSRFGRWKSAANWNEWNHSFYILGMNQECHGSVFDSMKKEKWLIFGFPFLDSRRKFEKVKNNSRKLAAIFLATVLGACLIKHANRAWAEVVSVWPNFPTRRCALLN